MPREQRDAIVLVTIEAGVVNVLTTTKYPWGG